MFWPDDKELLSKADVIDCNPLGKCRGLMEHNKINHFTTGPKYPFLKLFPLFFPLLKHFQLGYGLYFSKYTKQPPKCPKFQNPAKLSCFFTFQIQPSHQNNPVTAKNKGRKSRKKGIERKWRPTTTSGGGGPDEHHYQIGTYRLAIGVGPVAYVYRCRHMQRLQCDALWCIQLWIKTLGKW